MAERKGLDYVINLIDQVTKPVQSIAKEIDALGKRGKAAMEQIGYGIAGVVGVGMAMKSALGPAIDMSNAVSNIAATGMSAEGLAKVKKFAFGFSSTFGVLATDVVDSANEIVRAIDGLTDDEVISFTKSSNILAQATGSNVKEMGSYLSTMYGIFQQQADKMGKAKWVEQMAGQATLTANMFKSSGESLSQAFTNLMSTGEAKGIALAEQFAVLGNLQSVMPGGMSGTKYAAFLKGVGKAQKKLGLDFLDAQKRMRTMPEILLEIKKRYGDTIDEVEALQLSKAFGSDDAVAVINYLLPKIDSLKSNIKQIGEVSNLDEAIAISHTVTDVWQRFANILTNIKTIIGGQVLEKITPFLNRIADAGTYFVKWLEVNKNIARLLGYLVGGFLALGAIVPLVILITGIFKLWGVALSGLLLPFKLLRGYLGMFSSAGLISPFTAFFSLFKSGVVFIFGLIKTFGATLLTLLNPLKMLTMAFKLVFTPLTMWVGLFVLIYKFRTELSAFFQGVMKGFTQWGVTLEPVKQALGNIWQKIQGLIAKVSQMLGISQDGANNLEIWAKAGEIVGTVLANGFQLAIDALALVIDLIGDFAVLIVDAILGGIDMWQTFFERISSGDILGAFCALGEGIWNIFTGIFKKLSNMFVKTLNWLIEKINAFTGTNFSPITIPFEYDMPKMPDVMSSQHTVGNVASVALSAQQVAEKLIPNNAGSVQHFHTSPLNVPQPSSVLPIVQPNTKLDKGKTVSNVVNQANHNITNHNQFTINAANANAQEVASIVDRRIKEHQEMK